MVKPGQRGRPPHPDVLTPAEWRVVEGIRHGLSGRHIARRLGVSEAAVKYHVANVLAKLGLEKRAQLRRWSGLRRDSALSGRSIQMNATSLGAIGQISRQVSDIQAARRWYGDVLGLTPLYAFGDMAFFACGDVRLYLQQRQEGEPGSGGDSILYFRVEDIHAEHDRLAANGAVFISAPHLVHRHEDGMEEWMAFFNDPDGRPLALMAQVRPA